MSVTWVSSSVMWGKRVHEPWGGQEDPWTRYLNPSQGPGAPSLSPPLGLPFQKLVCEPGALGSPFSSAPKANPIRPSRILCHLKAIEAQPRVKCRSHGGEQLLLWDRRQVAPSLGPSGERADLAALWGLLLMAQLAPDSEHLGEGVALVAVDPRLAPGRTPLSWPSPGTSPEASFSFPAQPSGSGLTSLVKTVSQTSSVPGEK